MADGAEVEIDDGLDIEPPEDVVDIFDDRAQAPIDAEAIVNGMRQIRAQLAVSKINMRMAAAGLLPGQNIHPEQLKKDIQRGLDAIDLLSKIWADMGDNGVPTGLLDV